MRDLAVLGRWRLERVVEDRRAREQLLVEGSALLERLDDARVRWHEEGTLRAPSRAPTVVSRTLYVLPPEDDGTVWVTFEDGRPFHPWQPGVEVAHPCAPDHYRGTVSTERLPTQWETTWHCTGPHKDYTLRTTYTRPGREA